MLPLSYPELSKHLNKLWVSFEIETFYLMFYLIVLFDVYKPVNSFPILFRVQIFLNNILHI